MDVFSIIATIKINNNYRISNTCTSCEFCSTTKKVFGEFDELSHECVRNKDMLFVTYENYTCDKWKSRK